MPDDKMILILKYCLHHRLPTWHLLCAGGVFQCLECVLEDRIDAQLHRYQERLCLTPKP